MKSITINLDDSLYQELHVATQLTNETTEEAINYMIKEYVKKNEGTCKVYMAPFAVNLSEDGKNYLEPDMIVVCDKNKIKEDGCYGTPDFVIEIISKSTKARDYGIKTLKYRNSGVKEYWIVDPVREIVLTYWFEDRKGVN